MIWKAQMAVSGTGKLHVVSVLALSSIAACFSGSDIHSVDFVKVEIAVTMVAMQSFLQWLQ